MKKKNRPPSSSRTRGGSGEDNRALINRGRPRKNHSVAAVNFDKDDASKDSPAAGDVPQKHPDSKAKSSGKSKSTSSGVVLYSSFILVKLMLAAV